MLSNIDNLEIGKLMTYIFNIFFCACVTQVILHFVSLLVVNCEFRFENMM